MVQDTDAHGPVYPLAHVCSCDGTCGPDEPAPPFRTPGAAREGEEPTDHIRTEHRGDATTSVMFYF